MYLSGVGEGPRPIFNNLLSIFFGGGVGSNSPLDLSVDYFKEDPGLEMCKHTLSNDHAL